jgi:serine protease Do
MRLIKALCIVLVLAGVVVLAVALARPAYGQSRPQPESMRDFMLLEGAGSQIGVSARDLEASEAERLKVPSGVFVEDVRPESPAAKAGLKTSDVVTEFDGERVRSLRQFTRLVRETPPGRTVRAAIVRDGRRSEVSVTPEGGSRQFSLDGRQLRDQIEAFTARIPEFNFDFDFDPAGTARGQLGVTVQDLTPELATYFGAKDGVLVASVAADSAASRAGIRVGDVITSVNGRTVASRSDLVRELRDVRQSADVTLGIVRDKKESTLTAKIDVQQERRARPARPVRPLRRPIGSTSV